MRYDSAGGGAVARLRASSHSHKFLNGLQGGLAFGTLVEYLAAFRAVDALQRTRAQGCIANGDHACLLGAFNMGPSKLGQVTTGVTSWEAGLLPNGGEYGLKYPDWYPEK